MSVRDAITVIGTAVGAYFGVPQLGYAIGSALGNAVDPKIIKGPSIGDLARQTSMEGVPRPIIWALSPPMSGNIIDCSEPKTVRKRERQGKGGPKVETEHVYRTYAVGVCEGPINRFVRVWRNNTLVYDVSEFPQLTHEENVQFMLRARFFLGTWNQEPSPALEIIFGVGTTPAHRGTAYMVMDDEELTDLRGAVPQWMFQVERCEGYFVTSRPYAIESMDELDIAAGVSGALLWTNPAPDEATIGASVLGGDLFGGGIVYEDWPDESMTMDAAVLGGDIYGSGIVYEDWPDESATIEAAVLGGDLFGAGLVYENWPNENLNIVAEVLGGDLI